MPTEKRDLQKSARIWRRSWMQFCDTMASTRIRRRLIAVGSSILDDLDAYDAPDSGPVVMEANAGAIRTQKGTHWAAVGGPMKGKVLVGVNRRGDVLNGCAGTTARAHVRWWVPFLMPGAVGG